MVVCAAAGLTGACFRTEADTSRSFALTSASPSKALFFTLTMLMPMPTAMPLPVFAALAFPFAVPTVRFFVTIRTAPFISFS